MISPAVFLAQSPYETRLRGLRGAFDNRQNDPVDVQMIVVYLAVLGALILALVLYQRLRIRREDKRTPRHPMKLFNRVLRELGVGFVDRLLMRSLARSLPMEQPTTVLFNRSLFDQYRDRWLKSIGLVPLQAHAQRRLFAVAEKAFPPEPETAPEATADPSP
ncbi:MAG: hypothetical protein ACE5E1_03360 [Phycisphaerae bacterium]